MKENCKQKTTPSFDFIQFVKGFSTSSWNDKIQIYQSELIAYVKEVYNLKILFRKTNGIRNVKVETICLETQQY